MKKISTEGQKTNFGTEYKAEDIVYLNSKPHIIIDATNARQ